MSGMEDIGNFLSQGLEELQAVTADMGVTAPEPPSAPEPEAPSMPDMEPDMG